jgi:hypothetical protein
LHFWSFKSWGFIVRPTQNRWRGAQVLSVDGGSTGGRSGIFSQTNVEAPLQRTGRQKGDKQAPGHRAFCELRLREIAVGAFSESNIPLLNPENSESIPGAIS